jgi:hypothetical protein
MPFPLAHPAAVLPLRRFCPRWLSFPALVAGSLAPDASYLSGPLHLEGFSHRFVGSFGFALPVGLALLGLFYGLRGRVIAWLPERDRRALLPLCQGPPGPLVVVASLLAGAWTHLFLDSFTHPNGWLVLRFPILLTPVVFAENHTLRVCHLLWYGCSFAGIAWLCFVCLHWRDAVGGKKSNGLEWGNAGKALLAGVLVFPIELAHHLVHGALGLGLVAGLVLTVMTGIVLKLRLTG